MKLWKESYKSEVEKVQHQSKKFAFTTTASFCRQTWKPTGNHSNHWHISGAALSLQPISPSQKDPGATPNQPRNTRFPSDHWLYHIQYGSKLLSNACTMSCENLQYMLDCICFKLQKQYFDQAKSHAGILSLFVWLIKTPLHIFAFHILTDPNLLEHTGIIVEMEKSCTGASLVKMYIYRSQPNGNGYL